MVLRVIVHLRPEEGLIVEHIARDYLSIPFTRYGYIRYPRRVCVRSTFYAKTNCVTSKDQVVLDVVLDARETSRSRPGLGHAHPHTHPQPNTNGIDNRTSEHYSFSASDASCNVWHVARRTVKTEKGARPIRYKPPTCSILYIFQFLHGCNSLVQLPNSSNVEKREAGQRPKSLHP